MQRSAPFARATAMLELILTAMGDQAAMAAIGPYQSRGHGRGKPFDKQRHGNKAGKYLPHQSIKDCARRRRQNPTLHSNPQLIDFEIEGARHHGYKLAA